MTVPIKVLITGASGQIGYSLASSIVSGNVFGDKQALYLNLLEIPAVVTNLKGLVMELEDCNSPLLKGIVATGDPKEAFTDIDFAIMVGSMPRKEGMERIDLLKSNVTIFKAQGEALNQYSKKTVKVCVVGNPANTNCYIMSKFAPSIPKENFSALTRLDHNRALSQIALKADVSFGDVKKVIIWGNHSSTQFPDVSNGLIKMKDGKEMKVSEAIKDHKWLNEDFVKIVQTRGAAVIAARKLSSAMSAAKAISDHCRDWFLGTKEWVSMAVYSDGSYDAPKDVIFSFPVTITSGKWSIVKGLKIDDFTKGKIQITGKELTDEKNDAIGICE